MSKIPANQQGWVFKGVPWEAGEDGDKLAGIKGKLKSAIEGGMYVSVEVCRERDADDKCTKGGEFQFTPYHIIEEEYWEFAATGSGANRGDTVKKPSKEEFSPIEKYIYE